MNTGIQILIERMKTNPEEWATMTTRGRGKWEVVIVDYWDYLTEEDQNAYKAARDALLQEQFTEVVMKKLAGVGDDDGVSLTSVSHNDINPLNSYQQLRGMGQQALRVSTQNDEINQLQNSYQGMQQLGAGGSGGGTIYAGGGGGGSMLGNLAKNLGFK